VGTRITKTPDVVLLGVLGGGKLENVQDKALVNFGLDLKEPELQPSSMLEIIVF
jgi:hypothetical protein